ncbi:MAG: ECF transporter S component [Candidatus Pristimantibacillus lignocellulolyticus]|uniref:ECF transporter S component n=1 Tax=Candidatus Pristimantibacillus lignocellulolyticus TaxID=2994561 RepID=A0A9J6ZAH0_9BACL|nr:MAG: ECF transporter S component [Candidatus Pristimantibacillus lignocellulolyticus]
MYKLKLTDVVVIIMIGILFGVIMHFWNSLYDVIKPILPTLRQLFYGMWFMVGPFAYLVVRKPGAALIASVAGAALSSIMASAGLEVLMYGFIQGLAAELVFASFRYKKHNLVVAGFAGVLSCLGSFMLDLGYGYADLETWALIVKYGLRVISAFIFTGIFAYYIVLALEKTKVTSLVRPIDQKEFEQLRK